MRWIESWYFYIFWTIWFSHFQFHIWTNTQVLAADNRSENNKRKRVRVRVSQNVCRREWSYHVAGLRISLSLEMTPESPTSIYTLNLKFEVSLVEISFKLPFSSQLVALFIVSFLYSTMWKEDGPWLLSWFMKLKVLTIPHSFSVQ